MNTKVKVGLGVGGAVLALGAAVGVGAFAANLGTTDAATAPAGSVKDGRGGSGTRGGLDTAALARTLAVELGVDETKMAAALTEVMASSRPSGEPSGRPSGQPAGARNGGTGMAETMARELATKLELDEAKVLAALQKAMADQ